MIFRGTQIQRDEDGRCGFLPNRTLPSKKDELPSSSVLAHARLNLRDLVVPHPHLNLGGAVHAGV